MNREYLESSDAAYQQDVAAALWESQMRYLKACCSLESMYSVDYVNCIAYDIAVGDSDSN